MRAMGIECMNVKWDYKKEKRKGSDSTAHEKKENRRRRACGVYRVGVESAI